jgi:hypothetical protein
MQGVGCVMTSGRLGDPRELLTELVWQDLLENAVKSFPWYTVVREVLGHIFVIHKAPSEAVSVRNPFLV